MAKTEFKGKLKTWKDDRGFGFIKPEDDDKDVFIHISALKGSVRRPKVGDVVYYQTEKDNRGKFKAVDARIEGVEQKVIQSEKMLKTPADKWAAAALVVVLVVVIAIFAYVSYK